MREIDKYMPVKIIGGFPCRNCGCWSVEEKNDCEYYWVDFGVVLIEEITIIFAETASAYLSKLPIIRKKSLIRNFEKK